MSARVPGINDEVLTWIGIGRKREGALKQHGSERALRYWWCSVTCRSPVVVLA